MVDSEESNEVARRLVAEHLAELSERLFDNPHGWTPRQLWLDDSIEVLLNLWESSFRRAAANAAVDEDTRYLIYVTGKAVGRVVMTIFFMFRREKTFPTGDFFKIGDEPAEDVTSLETLLKAMDGLCFYRFTRASSSNVNMADIAWEEELQNFMLAHVALGQSFAEAEESATQWIRDTLARLGGNGGGAEAQARQTERIREKIIVGRVLPWLRTEVLEHCTPFARDSGPSGSESTQSRHSRFIPSALHRFK